MRNKKGQLKKISIAVILVFLLTIVVITAQDNLGTIQQETQKTETQENVNLQSDSETTNETDTNTNTETINDLCENINCNISTLICPDGFIATCENSCVSETGTCSTCIPDCTGHEQNTVQPNQTTGNETRENETNGTIAQPEENESIIPPGTGLVIGEDTSSPKLEIQLLYPAKITRGEIIEVKAIITNSGAKTKKVIANWILTQDFEIISGILTENCGDMNTEESCTSTITVRTSFSTTLGKNQIKIIASYEK